MRFPLVNQRGERRAYIDFLEENGRPRLKDLWFMWSVCNLECKHCYVSSSPRNKTLETQSLDEVQLLHEEGTQFGMEHVYYTGGEPFVNPQMMPILEASLRKAPTTVLTNATQPIRRRLDALERMEKKNPGRLTFRVSLDSFEEQHHDSIRGDGAFRMTVETCIEMLDRGLRTIITSTPIVFEDRPVTLEEAETTYRRLFDNRVEFKLIPITLGMGAEVDRSGEPLETPFLTERHMRGASLEDYQCHYSRCVQKINGKLRIYPCPIIYNDENYDLGATLEESFQRIYMTHHACVQFCYKAGGKCGDDRRSSAQRDGNSRRMCPV